MKMLYIGYLIEEKECLVRKGTSIAGNKMQAGLLKAISKKHNEDLTILSINPSAPYPLEKQVFFKFKKTTVGGLNQINIPFVNFQGIKQLTQIIFLILYIIIWRVKNQKESRVLLCYNSNLTTGIIAYIAKFLLHFKTICFVADPVMDVVSISGIKKFLWGPFKNISNSLLKFFDGLIVVNKNVVSEFAPNLPYVIVEGGFFSSDYSGDLDRLPYYNNKSRNFEVFFAGALHEYNGIRLIIDAAERLEKRREDILFIIYGEGELKEELIKASERLTNIKYMGLKSNDIIRQEMFKADILLNIRATSDLISRYTFPSKIIEYMISGKAIISTLIDGVPDEYLNYLYLLNNENGNQLANLIEEILVMDYDVLNSKGIQAREFMLKNKTWDVVSNRLSNFFSSINTNKSTSNKVED